MNQTTISIVSGVLCPGFYDRVFKIFTIFLLVFALSANGVTAQEQRPRNGIAVGEVVPDDIWRGVNQSYEGGTSDGSEPLGIMPLTLSQYKGKLILLDFWATYCVPCISNFTKMKLLQEKYRNDLQIILVNNEPVSKATGFLSGRRTAHGEIFNAVVSDTLLNNAFPHRTIPHYVWIGRDGKVMAITGEEEIEDSKLLRALAGDNKDFVNKKNIDPALHLFSSADLPTEGLLRYSLLTRGRVSGLPSGTQFRKSAVSGVLVGRAFTNTDFFSLYGTIGRILKRNSGNRFSDKQVRYIGVDSARFFSEIYNYEFVVPERFSTELYPMMLTDLNTYSPYVATFERRNIDCLILENVGRLANGLRVTGEGGEEKERSLGSGNGRSGVLELKNVGIPVLVDYLEDLGWNSVPVVDQTGMKGHISMVINVSGGVKGVNAELGRYGLRLRAAKLKTILMVIRDQPGQKPKF